VKKLKVLCVCGHTKAKHKGVVDIFDRFWEDACSAVLPDHSSCVCWNYKGDNLRYLERLLDD